MKFFWNILAFFIIIRSSSLALVSFHEGRIPIGLLCVCACIAAIYVLYDVNKKDPNDFDELDEET